MEISEEWLKKWRSHQRNAITRGLRYLTPDQYMAKVKEAGIERPDQIGRGSNQFNLGRVGDTGDYTESTCRFITSSKNKREAYENGCHEEHMKVRRSQTKENTEWLQRLSETYAGWSKETQSFLARASEQNSKNYVIIAPDGTIYEGRNVREFCKDRGLSNIAMSNVLRGDAKQHQGWRGHYVPDEPIFIGYFHEPE